MRRLHCLLILFILLPMQCVAPLAHAHIDGHHDHRGVHMDLFSADLSDDHIAFSNLHVAAPAIGMPVANGTSLTALELAPPSSITLLIPPSAVYQTVTPRLANPPISAHWFGRPFSQAPPV